MVLSVSEHWKREVSRSGAELVYWVRMELGPAAFISIDDWHHIFGASITITTTTGTGNSALAPFSDHTQVFTEGSSWHAATSNEATAASLSNAICALANDYTIAGRPSVNQTLGVLAWYYGNTVVIAPAQTDGDTRAVEINITLSPDPVVIGLASYSATALDRYYQFVSGQRIIDGVDPIISNVTSISRSIDPLTRQCSIGAIDIEFTDDGRIRDLMSRSRPKNRKVEVRIGTANLQWSEFAPVGLYIISDVIPQPGKVTLRCEDQIAAMVDKQLAGHWMPMHPAQVIHQAIIRAEYPIDYDVTTLEPSDATPNEWQDRYGHWVVTRNGEYQKFPTVQLANSTQTNWSWGNAIPEISNDVTSPISAKQIIDEMCTLMHGSMPPDELGLHRFKIFESTDSPVRTLGDDDISDLVQEKMCENQITSVVVSGAQNPDNSASKSSRVKLFEIQDYAASILSSNNGRMKKLDHKIDSDWLGLPVSLQNTQSLSTNGIWVTPAYICGFSGMAVADGIPQSVIDSYLAAISYTVSQAGWSQLNSTRQAYFMLMDLKSRMSEIVSSDSYSYFHDLSAGNYSRYYVKVKAGVYQVPQWNTIGTPSAISDDYVFDPSPATLAYGDAVRWNVQLDPASGKPVFIPADTFAMFNTGVYNINARNLFNSSPFSSGPDWRAVPFVYGQNVGDPYTIRAYDITIPLYLAQRILDRFRWGCPIVSVRVPVHHWDLQLGDFVTVVNDVYMGPVSNGSTTSTVFEVIQKDLLALDDSPCVELKLAWVRDNVTPPIASVLPPVSVSGSGGMPGTFVADEVVDNAGDLVIDNSGAFVFVK